MPIRSPASVVRNACEAGTVGHLEIPVGHVVEADEGQAVDPDGDGAVLADVVLALESDTGRNRAGYVGAMGNLEVAVGDVVVADEATAVCPDGY